MKKKELADLIYAKIVLEQKAIQLMVDESKKTIAYFYIDNLLPDEIVYKIHQFFPKSNEMILKKSIKENKYIAVQMNQYNSLLEEIIYAFQDDRIVTFIANIFEIKEAFADKNLYAGGLSMMEKNQFLNPHLDNSHDKDRKLWRVLNLLYYTTPNWQKSFGGNLELWPNGLKQKQITIESKFNRLVVMATHSKSIHSVSSVVYDGYRQCVSNYYFSAQPLCATDKFHVTSFRARPEQKIKDAFLQLDTWSRMMIRKIFKKGIVENPHVYKKE